MVSLPALAKAASEEPPAKIKSAPTNSVTISAGPGGSIMFADREGNVIRVNTQTAQLERVVVETEPVRDKLLTINSDAFIPGVTVRGGR